jgi:hypothetical protein
LCFPFVFLPLFCSVFFAPFYSSSLSLSLFDIKPHAKQSEDKKKASNWFLCSWFWVLSSDSEFWFWWFCFCFFCCCCCCCCCCCALGEWGRSSWLTGHLRCLDSIHP